MYHVKSFSSPMFKKKINSFIILLNLHTVSRKESSTGISSWDCKHFDIIKKHHKMLLIMINSNRILKKKKKIFLILYFYFMVIKRICMLHILGYVILKLCFLSHRGIFYSYVDVTITSIIGPLSIPHLQWQGASYMTVISKDLWHSHLLLTI